MPKPLKRTLAIVRKELTQTLRDWPTLVLILTLPVILLLIFASLGDLQLDHIPTIVADQSQDAQSSALISALEASGCFDVTAYAASEQQVIAAIDAGEAMVGLVIPAGFASQVEGATTLGEPAQVLFIIDGSDTFIVQSSYSTASAIAQTHAYELLLQTAERMGQGGALNTPIQAILRVLYNANLNTMIFLIPGVAAIVLEMLTVALTALSIVRERELGTMEQVLVTPARPLEIIFGKLLPGVLLAALDLAIVLGLGVFAFKVPVNGSWWLFAWLSVLFIVSGLGLGLVVSTIAKNQQQVQEIVMVAMLLGLLLTGVIYPRSTMPPLVRAVGNLLPSTYFVRIARGVITKGIGLTFLWQDVVALAIYGTVAVVIAALTFRRRLD